MENIQVVLADDHVLVRNGIKALLEDQEDIIVIDEISMRKVYKMDRIDKN